MTEMVGAARSGAIRADAGSDCGKVPNRIRGATVASASPAVEAAVMTQNTIVALAVLGVAGQAFAAAPALAGGGALLGVQGPLRAVRSMLWGYELWAAFLIAAIGTGGSLFFSEVAHFVPCELCWYQRICMYPLSLTLLLAAR